MSDYLQHEGVDHLEGNPGSGRYSWGSGENPYQHGEGFMDSYRQVKKLHPEWTDTEIAKNYFGMSSNEFRAKKTVERSKEQIIRDQKIEKLWKEGYSKTAISEKVGCTEGNIRAVLKKMQTQEYKEKKSIEDIANELKKQLETKKYLDIGEGTATYMKIADTKLTAAVKHLKDEGYVVENIYVPQVANPNQDTTVKVLASPGTTRNEINKHREDIGIINPINVRSDGKTFMGIKPPKSLDSSRLKVVYAEDGGKDMDGVIQLRRGVEDISLGGANYAQVRIAVDGTHYLKGMAIYSDNMPPGVDVIFNTNKSKNVPMLGPKNDESVLKLLKTDKKTGEVDQGNPFGTTLRMVDGEIVGQREYVDKNGETQLSVINIVRQEGDWDTWSRTLSSQFLGKQSKSLIKQQLDKSYKEKEEEYKEILKVTQPEVKASLLQDFAADCDTSATDLKAAKLPRQTNKVILPLTEISENEVYAPGYKDGEILALVRHPHAGIFEIPILRNNTKIAQGKELIGDAIDAIGINPKTAGVLSGADFDGDTVLVLPNNDKKIQGVSEKLNPAYAELKNFEPKEQYKKYPGMRVMNKREQQVEMGKVSNLITDMNLAAADPEEIVRAVKHSMVVIDAEKHELDWKRSELENDIKSLKKKYQGRANAGAATILSRANKEIDVPTRKELIDKETGKIIKREDLVKNKFKIVPEYKNQVDEDGNKIPDGWKEVRKTKKSRLMKETDDAYELVRDENNVKERLYADYANSLKVMANDARKIAVNTERTKKNKDAEKAYASEVSSLNAKLNLVYKNKPIARKTQTLASIKVAAQKKSNPELYKDKKEMKKVRVQAMAAARAETGYSRKDSIVPITDKEWEAINSGALSSEKIKSIIANANPDRVKQLAMPRNDGSLSPAKIARIKSYSDSGYNARDIADMLQVSISTVHQYIREDNVDVE